MINIEKKFISQNFYHGRQGNVIKFIVIHDTGNYSLNANAYMHYVWLNGGYRGVSANYFIDDKRIINTVDDKNGSWHCGDDTGHGRYLNGATNLNSLGLEMCVNRDGNYQKAFNNTVDLTKYLMKKYNIPSSRVVRHYDVSRKTCPLSMSGNNWERWKEFKRLISDKNYTQPVDNIVDNPTDEYITTFAREVIRGKYGNGFNRQVKIYETVQNEVNNILYKRTLRNDYVTEMAKDVIKGVYGNGEVRKKLLYKTIQDRVNSLL